MGGWADIIVNFDVPSSKAGTTYRIEWWGLHCIGLFITVR